MFLFIKIIIHQGFASRFKVHRSELADGLNGKPGHFYFFQKTRSFLTFEDKIFLKIPGRSLK
jgi:hypothetical protein